MQKKYLKYYLGYYKKYGNYIIVVSLITITLASVVVLVLATAHRWERVLGLSNEKIAWLEMEDKGRKRIFEGEIIESMTILDALNASALAGDITFKYVIDGRKNNLTILVLDGHYDSPSSRLSFYLNSEKVEPQKIHSIPIWPGDIVTVRSE